MSSKKFNEYKTRFLEGDLSPEEEQAFSKLLSENQDAGSKLFQRYFELAGDTETPAFTPVSKEKFIASVGNHRKKKRKRVYRIATATAACVMLGLVGYWSILHREPERTRVITREEIDRSFETTRLALSSFSSHFNKGLKNIDKGIDLSMPFESLSKLKTDETPTNK